MRTSSKEKEKDDLLKDMFSKVIKVDPKEKERVERGARSLAGVTVALRGVQGLDTSIEDLNKLGIGEGNGQFKSEEHKQIFLDVFRKMRDELTNPNKPGTLIKTVNKDTFENEVLKSDKPAVVDFFAYWCGPCMAFSPVMEELAKERPDVKFVKVDVDANQELTDTYKIMSIPTAMLFVDGKVKGATIGAVPKEKILKLLDENQKVDSSATRA